MQVALLTALLLFWTGSGLRGSQEIESEISTEVDANYTEGYPVPVDLITGAPLPGQDFGPNDQRALCNDLTVKFLVTMYAHDLGGDAKSTTCKAAWQAGSAYKVKRFFRSLGNAYRGEPFIKEKPGTFSKHIKFLRCTISGGKAQWAIKGDSWFAHDRPLGFGNSGAVYYMATPDTQVAIGVNVYKRPFDLRSLADPTHPPVETTRYCARVDMVYQTDQVRQNSDITQSVQDSDLETINGFPKLDDHEYMCLNLWRNGAGNNDGSDRYAILEPFAALRNHEVYVIADSSGSMAEKLNDDDVYGQQSTRWAYLQYTLAQVVQVASCMLPSHVPVRVHIFGRPSPQPSDRVPVPYNPQFWDFYPNYANPLAVKNLVQQALNIPPGGGTPLVAALDYVERTVRASQDQGDCKPTVLVIVTDGEPSPHSRGETVANFRRKLESLKGQKPSCGFKVSFVSIGPESEVMYVDCISRILRQEKKLLKQGKISAGQVHEVVIDNSEQYTSEKPDFQEEWMLDNPGASFHWGVLDWIQKVLLGSIDPDHFGDGLLSHEDSDLQSECSRYLQWDGSE